MKKILLFVALFSATVCASAQEYAIFQSKLNAGSEATEVAQGTDLGSTSIAKATIGATDKYKSVGISGPKSAAGNAYSSVIIDGVTIPGGDGIQGATNPKDADGGAPSSTLIAPTSGAFIQFDVVADGYLYVIAKMSSNKSYTVFEEGSAIPYYYSEATDGSTLPNPFSYTLKGTYDAANDVEFITLADHPNGIQWPERIYAGMDVDTISTKAVGDNAVGTAPSKWTKIGQNGLGVIGFKCYKDCKYIVNANGSKISALGFYTSKEEAKNIELSTGVEGDETITLCKDGVYVNMASAGDPTAINEVKSSSANSDVMYNLAGQKVSADYKGVVIKNGKKIMK